MEQAGGLGSLSFWTNSWK